MSYASSAQMLGRFGEQELILLSNHDGRSDSVNEPALAQALSDASAEIDGYLAGRYPLPLSKTPAVLESLCCDMARYKLSNEHAPEPIEKRYQAALKFLHSVGKGELSLGVDPEGAVATSANLPEISSAGTVFSRAQSKGFI
ncbi:gp436 family protein [Agarivorans sp. QJM3NY_25]|uniref:gp436 family protein n=1 Tax=Agarivorans sp. QJM3NY_25 TaxID=3421430 RepID=UPI003D7EBD7C